MKTMMILIALVFAPAIASADSTADDQGKLHSDRGQALYREGKYREARAEFERGFELSGRAAFLFNVAECSRLLGEAATARAQYDKYLAIEPDGKLAATAKQRLASLPAAPAAVTTTPLPSPKPVEVPPTVVVTTPPAPPPPHAMPATIPAAPHHGSGAAPPLSAFITGGVGVVALGAAGVLAVRARSKWSDAQDHCVDNRCSLAGVDLAKGARLDANFATAGVIVGAAALVTGSYLWWRDRRERRAGFAVAPAVAPSTIGVALGGGF